VAPVSAPLWTPSPAAVREAEITRFAAGLGREVEDYASLWRWSVEDLDGFWSAIVTAYGVDLGDGPGVVRGPVLGERGMPGAHWFPEATVSYPEHVFRGRDPGAVAIRHASELHDGLGSWTWGELRAATARIAAGLAGCGVGRGDRVCAYLGNLPETVAAFLACASLGAVWSSAAPEFGARSVIDRFAQVAPTVLLAVDGYRYGGRDFDRGDIVAELVAALPGTRVVRFGHLDGSGWEDGFLAPEEVELRFERVGFMDPLWVLYSSGTTGLPKAIVHSQGGILLEQVKAGHLHIDARAADRVFWFTTTGWMMWNFLVGILLTPASIVLFDGHPGHPSLERLWDLAEEAGITCLGTSAAFIASCMKAGVRPRGGGRTLSSLRSVGSTGSPLSPEGFSWIYDAVGSDTWLFSTSGGTDVCTSFVGGVPTLPVYRGELQARCLGCAVQAWSPDGEPLIGEVGELVITEPMPSMPIGLWDDDDGARLRETYFSMYPGVWRHGDWIEITDRGTAIITGRSDSTINRGGVRMGTAEIYRAVLEVDAVLDALVVDLPRDGGDSWMPLYVVLRDGVALDDALVAEIRARVRSDCSPRHVPDEVVAIAAVPRTLSGKVLEVPVKRILMGVPAEQAASRESLANPEALDWFAARAAAGG
jgi:acetoacetyl-CoA synthetase